MYELYKQYLRSNKTISIKWCGTYCILLNLKLLREKNLLEPIIQTLKQWHPEEGAEDRWMTKYITDNGLEGLLIGSLNSWHIKRDCGRVATFHGWGNVGREWRINKLIWDTGMPLLENNNYEEELRKVEDVLTEVKWRLKRFRRAFGVE